MNFFLCKCRIFPFFATKLVRFIFVVNSSFQKQRLVGLFPAGVNCINILHTAFALIDPESVKNTG